MYTISRIWTLILAVTLLLSTTSSLDSGTSGTRIILQSDVQTVVISQEVSSIDRQIKRLQQQSKNLHLKILEGVNSNKLKRNEQDLDKLLVGLVNTNHEKLLILGERMADMKMTKGEQANLDKRALEILGSFLSTSGVPSARDHRKVIEQLNVLRDETKGIEMLLDRAQSQDRDIITKLHTFNRITETMGEKLIYEEEEISKNTNNLKKVTSIVSVLSLIHI